VIWDIYWFLVEYRPLYYNVVLASACFCYRNGLICFTVSFQKFPVFVATSKVSWGSQQYSCCDTCKMQTKWYPGSVRQCDLLVECVCFGMLGVQGILSAYQMCLNHVVLYGPTNFAPIIYHAAQFAAASKSETTPKVWFYQQQMLSVSSDYKFLSVVLYCPAFRWLYIFLGTGENSSVWILDVYNMICAQCGFCKDNTLSRRIIKLQKLTVFQPVSFSVA